MSLFLEYLLLTERELMCLLGAGARGDRAMSCDVV